MLYRGFMLYRALLFLVVALVSGIFAFSGTAGAGAWAVQVLFVVALVLFVLSLFAGRRAPRT